MYCQEPAVTPNRRAAQSLCRLTKEYRAMRLIAEKMFAFAMAVAISGTTFNTIIV